MTLPSNPFRGLWRALPSQLQNKYYLTLVAFAFLLCFVDKNSLYKQYALHKHVRTLEDEKVYFEQKIKEVRIEAEDFEETKERYAREHYFMKRSNEDVYVIKKGQ
jgi:cell division protein DivIC